MEVEPILHSAEWINLLCRVWAQGRSPVLKAIINADRLIPLVPPTERTLAALVVDDAELLSAERDKLWTCWLTACEDQDAEIASRAKRILRQIHDPAFLFAYEEWEAFEHLVDPWPEIRMFYAMTNSSLKSRLRHAAMSHNRLDWVHEMTSHFEPATIAKMDVDELKAVLLIALRHRRRVDLVRIVTNISPDLPHDFWDGLLSNVVKENPSAGALWELAQLCPARDALCCLHALKQIRLEANQCDAGDLDSYRAITDDLPADSTAIPAPRPVEWNGFKQLYRESLRRTWKTVAHSTLTELVTDGDTFQVSRKTDDWTISCIGGRFRGFVVGFECGGKSDCIVRFDGRALHIRANTHTVLPASSVLVDLLAGQLPHAVLITDLERLVEIRSICVSDDDRKYATFVLETILWAQRQQRVALATAVEIPGRFTIVDQDEHEEEERQKSAV